MVCNLNFSRLATVYANKQLLACTRRVNLKRTRASTVITLNNAYPERQIKLIISVDKDASEDELLRALPL